MEALSPLAAFQALCITTAAAVFIDARREASPWRYIFGALAASLALLGVFAEPIGEAWPAALSLMQELGGSVIPWFAVVVAVYSAIRPLWKRRATPMLSDGDSGDTPLSLEKGPYDDTGVRAEIEAIKGRLAPFEKDLVELAIHNRFREGRARNEILKKASEALKEYWTQIEKHEIALENYNNRTNRAIGALPPGPPPPPLTLTGLLVSAGATQEEINAAVGARRREIETKNSYVLLDDSDRRNRNWKDGADKKRWHHNRAQAVAIDKIINSLKVPDSKLTDDALLRELRELRMRPRV